MQQKLRAALAVLVGLVVGGLLNGAIIAAGPSLIPPPVGADMTTAEGLTAAMSLLEPKHFIMPFLAHALGTLAGALAGCLIAAAHRTFVAYTIGVAFLCGGIAACFMIPAPAWFMVLDLVAAYLPMAWLGLNIANKITPTDR